MRSRFACLLAILVLPGVGAASAEEVARASVAVAAQFASRTSLKVSSELLRFDGVEAGATATASIEFIAGARTPSNGDVVLTIEPLHAIDGPGGASDVETSLSVKGEGQGLVATNVNTASATVIGRWQGSGLRAGRLVFSLRTNGAGNLSVPVRVVLSTPERFIDTHNFTPRWPSSRDSVRCALARVANVPTRMR